MFTNQRPSERVNGQYQSKRERSIQDKNDVHSQALLLARFHLVVGVKGCLAWCLHSNDRVRHESLDRLEVASQLVCPIDLLHFCVNTILPRRTRVAILGAIGLWVSVFLMRRY